MADPSFYEFLHSVTRQLRPDTRHYEFRGDRYNIALSYVNIPECSNESFIYYTELFDKILKKHIKLVIKKQALDTRTLRFIDRSFQSEIHFYSKIYTSLRAFERQFKLLESLIPIPEYITSESKPGHEAIILKNLRKKKFKHNRLALDEHHCRSIFEAYGQFHAVSFCWKNQNPEQFKNIANSTEVFAKTERNRVDKYKETLPCVLRQVLKMLKKLKLNHLKQKLEPYLINFEKILNNADEYEADNSDCHCLLHGNGQLNNIMFKYHAGTQQVATVKLLGFGATRFGLPIKDLLQFFYRELDETSMLLNKYHSFLDSYYESFSTTIRQFNQDPNELFPKYLLLQHWQLLIKYSMLIALPLLDAFPLDDENKNITYYSTTLPVCDLLQHMYNNNLL